MTSRNENNKFFQHFLFTPFNALPSWLASFPDETWHKHRFKLFDQFCYPSVIGQSNQNFKWIVVFSVNTLEVYKRKIEEYAEYENFIPIYIPEDKHPDEVPHEVISKYLLNDKSYIITTRIETDDALCRDYVEMVQQYFDKQEFEFINFSNGYVWNMNTYEIYLDKQPSNPFISLIEEIDNIKNIDRFPTPYDKYPKYPVITNRRFVTVWNGISHPEFKKIGPYKDIEAEPSWLQGVHGDNLVNKPRGILQPPKLIKHLDTDFELRKNLMLPCFTASYFYFIKQILNSTRKTRHYLGLTGSQLKQFKGKLRR